MTPSLLVKRIINKLGFELRRYQGDQVAAEPIQLTWFRTLIKLRDLPVSANDPGEDWRFLKFCEDHLRQSRSQLLQDLFVLFVLREKSNGFFVEFGATDGVSLNNTYSLEKRHGWTGILAEPARCWHERLKQYRSCAVDFRCVWDKTGDTLMFKEVADDPELSTLSRYADSDMHKDTRRKTDLDYAVETVSLNDLLEQHASPPAIDYLSIDTEGSELQILRSLDFDAYDIRVITVEHNYTHNREGIHDLLAAKDYQRKFEELSLWEDWYVRE